MKGRTIPAIAVSMALLLPQAGQSQQQGAVELGAFGRYTIYDSDIGIENAIGFGGRLGVFVLDNLSVEGEVSYAEPDLTDKPGFQGRNFISHELWEARAVYTYWMGDKAGLMFGAGYAYDNYSRVRNVAARGGGPSGLLGLRYKFSDLLSLRVAGQGYHVSEDLDTDLIPRVAATNFSVQAGLSVLLRDREIERVVELPAPPPDTVVVTREVAPPLPQGTPTQICLATGENVTIYITPQGDTLVGDRRVPVGALGPGVAFAGEYADGAAWYVADEPIQFEDREYLRSGGNVGLDCANIMQVGEYQGVPLFADAGAESPYETLYVPVRPGVWQAYQTDLTAVRAE
jgi:hypothetical protein